MKKAIRTPDEPRDGLRKAALGYALAMSLVLDLGVCVAGGVWLDRRLGTSPVWTLIGVLGGCVLGAATVWLVNRLAGAEASKSKRPPT